LSVAGVVLVFGLLETMAVAAAAVGCLYKPTPF
jgi:hypothetical protein